MQDNPLLVLSFLRILGTETKEQAHFLSQWQMQSHAKGEAVSLQKQIVTGTAQPSHSDPQPFPVLSHRGFWEEFRSRADQLFLMAAAHSKLLGVAHMEVYSKYGISLIFLEWGKKKFFFK